MHKRRRIIMGLGLLIVLTSACTGGSVCSGSACATDLGTPPVGDAQMNPPPDLSSPGPTWTSRESGTANLLSGVAWSGTSLVAVGFRGTILYSKDGTTWTAASTSIPQANYYLAATYGNGLFVAVGTNGYGTQYGGIIATSPDGITWSAPTSATTPGLSGVAYGNGTYVAVGNLGSIEWSSDAMTWNATAGPASHLDGVAFLNGKFIITGHDGTLMTSTDGRSWTSGSLGVTTVFYRAAFGNNLYLVPGASGSSAAVLTSTDLMTWTQTLATGETFFRNVAFADGMFAVIGADGILTSPDGKAWTTVVPSTVIQGGDIVWTGTKFVAVGNGGVIFTRQ